MYGRNKVFIHDHDHNYGHNHCDARNSVQKLASPVDRTKTGKMGERKEDRKKDRE